MGVRRGGRASRRKHKAGEDGNEERGTLQHWKLSTHTCWLEQRRNSQLGGSQLALVGDSHITEAFKCHVEMRTDMLWTSRFSFLLISRVPRSVWVAEDWYTGSEGCDYDTAWHNAEEHWGRTGKSICPQRCSHAFARDPEADTACSSAGERAGKLVCP